MKKIIEILMRRDGLTENEAHSLLDECQRLIIHCIETGGTYYDAVDIIEDMLGLEPDYLDLFLP